MKPPKLPAHALLQMSDQEQAEREAEGGDPRWIMVHAGDGTTNEIKLLRRVRPSVLYRGQNRHYDPSWPSICRGFSNNTYRVSDLSPIDKARLLRGLALNQWFAHELSAHPMMVWATSHQIFVDKIAIAQHYGIPTGYVDLSESFAVSTFFATCRYVAATQTWEPMDQGEGVMYRVNVEAANDRAAAICYQPFPRPSQQWAWTLELLLGEDFLQAPMLQAFCFDHDAKVGNEILKRFDGGQKLLPPDPTARIAAAMRDGSEIPIGYVEEVEADLADDPSGFSTEDVKTVRRILQDQLKCRLCNASTVSYTEDELQEAERDWSAILPNFYRGVGIQLVRTRREHSDT